MNFIGKKYFIYIKHFYMLFYDFEPQQTDESMTWATLLVNPLFKQRQ